MYCRVYFEFTRFILQKQDQCTRSCYGPESFDSADKETEEETIIIFVTSNRSQFIYIICI